MTSIRVLRTYPDKSQLEVQVFVETSYPDALDQARATAIATYLALPDVEQAE